MVIILPGAVLLQPSQAMTHHFALDYTLPPIICSSPTWCLLFTAGAEASWGHIFYSSSTSPRVQRLLPSKSKVHVITLTITIYWSPLMYQVLYILFLILKSTRDRYFYLHYGNWGSEKLKNLSKVTELLWPWEQGSWKFFWHCPWLILGAVAFHLLALLSVIGRAVSRQRKKKNRTRGLAEEVPAMPWTRHKDRRLLRINYIRFQEHSPKVVVLWM